MKPHDSSKEEEKVWRSLKRLLKQDKEGRKILADLRSGKSVETQLRTRLKKHLANQPQLSTYVSSGGTVGKIINVARAETVNFYGSKAFERVSLVLAIFIIGMIGGLYLFFWHIPHHTQYFLVNNPPLQLPGLTIPGEQQKKEAQQQVIQYQQEVKKNPNSAVAQTNLGEALRRIGDLKGAANAQEKALDLKPNLAEAKLGQSLIEQDKGNITEATIKIQEALKHKDIAIAYYQLARILVNHQEPPDYKGGEAAIRRAIQLDKNTKRQYLYRMYLSTYLVSQNKVESAINEVNIAINMYPNFKFAYVLLAIILLDEKKSGGRSNNCIQKIIKT
jgi:tetratricopeptide (TPR) repeat protein